MNKQRLIDANALVPDIGDAEIENGTRFVHYSAGCIKNAPTIEAREHGRWILVESYGTAESRVRTALFRCSACKKEMIERKDRMQEHHRYCHNCGAKMDGRDEK